MELVVDFSGECWVWRAEKGTWHFITLPESASEEIQFFNSQDTTKKRGWGSVKVKASIGKTEWETSIFPHKSLKSFILPVKAAVRKAEAINSGENVSVKLVVFL